MRKKILALCVKEKLRGMRRLGLRIIAAPTGAEYESLALQPRCSAGDPALGYFISRRWRQDPRVKQSSCSDAIQTVVIRYSAPSNLRDH